MKVIVTGSSGFIGFHLVNQLVALGHEVIGMDDMGKKYWNTDKDRNRNDINHQITFVQDNVVTTKLIKEYKPNVVIHLANLAGVRRSIDNPMDYIRVNVEGTTNLLDQIKKHSPKTLFIYASSSSVYGNRQGEFKETDQIEVERIKSPYALSKKMIEDLALFYHLTCNISCVGLRFFTVYGERGRLDMAPYKFLDALNNNKTITQFGNGDTYRDYTYVGDIVNGIIKVMEYHYVSPSVNEIYNLGNNNPITLNEFIKTCEEVTNKKTKIVIEPIPSSDVFGTYANIDKAKKIGYLPQTSLHEGLSKMNKDYFN